MRSKALQILSIVFCFTIAPLICLSVPCVRAQGHPIVIPSDNKVGFLYSIRGPLSSSCYGADHGIRNSVLSTSRQRLAMLYGTGTMDCKEDYLVGVRVRFRFKSFAELGHAITGIFHKPGRGNRKGLASISVVFDGPDF